MDHFSIDTQHIFAGLVISFALKLYTRHLLHLGPNAMVLMAYLGSLNGLDIPAYLTCIPLSPPLYSAGHIYYIIHLCCSTQWVSARFAFNRSTSLLVVDTFQRWFCVKTNLDRNKINCSVVADDFLISFWTNFHRRFRFVINVDCGAWMHGPTKNTHCWSLYMWWKSFSVENLLSKWVSGNAMTTTTTPFLFLTLHLSFALFVSIFIEPNQSLVLIFIFRTINRSSCWNHSRFALCVSQLITISARFDARFPNAHTQSSTH